MPGGFDILLCSRSAKTVFMRYKLISDNKYFGEEKISRLLIRFSLPCVLGLLIGALYNIVDQIFIGNSELGFLGNAATGISFPVICIVNAFAWCIGDGAASYLSISSGRGDGESAHKCVGTCITVTTLISIVLTVLSLIFAEPLMVLFGASENTLGLAVDYFVIIVSFFVIYLLMNVMNGIIRVDGSPGYSMFAMLIGAITNIILDPIFIYALKWGIKGAAIATVIGQLASFVTCVIYLTRPKSFKLKRRSFIPDKRILKQTVALGAATFINQMSIAALSVLTNMVLSHFGELSVYGKDIAISVFSIQSKVYTVVCNIAVGIVLGGQPIFGYNFGAGKIERVKKTYLIVLLSTLILGMVSTLIFQLKPQIIINLFGAGNELYLEFATKTFRIYLSCVTITCLVKISAIFFQSIGKPVQAVVSSLVRDIVCFAPLVLILSNIWEANSAGSGINGILYAAPIADVISLFVIVILTVSFFASPEMKNKNK